MDSITFALARAVRAADVRQRAADADKDQPGAVTPSTSGLQPLADRPQVGAIFTGRSKAAHHISLAGDDEETVTLFFEFAAAGWTPPCALLTDGADVIIDRDVIEVHVAAEDGTHWYAQLSSSLTPNKPGQPSVRRASWAVVINQGER